MEVILLEKIRHLGTLGKQVKVKPGFARNYLIPHGKAVYANAANIEKFEKRRSELEQTAALRHEEALKRQQLLQALPVVVITAKASEEGKLFGSIGARDILSAIQKLNVTVEKRDLRLPHSLRTVGEYDIMIDLESDLTAQVKVSVIPGG